MAHLERIEGVFIHEEALVETDHIGQGTRIWAFAHILDGASIGKNCNICDHTFIEGDVIIGDDVTIKCGAYLWDGLRIEDNVFIGPNATFTNDLRPRSKSYPDAFVQTMIGRGASIGANATIVCGITIGKWALIGAGSVVTKDVPGYSLVYGNPARLRGYICECTRNISFENSFARCECGKTYQDGPDGIVRTE